MSTKKMQKTLDSVQTDVRELAEAFWAFRDEVMTQQAVRAAESQSPREDRFPTPESDMPSAGHLSLSGSYEMTNGRGETRVFRWAMEERPVEDVLVLPVNEAAGFLAAIGHRQRLGIVLLLLREAATANDIVTRLSLGTTGAAYHHLNVLQGAGIVEQAQRGTFSISPKQVPSLIAMLSGLSGLIQSAIEERPTPVEQEEAAS